jgi:hypothetical protein
MMLATIISAPITELLTKIVDELFRRWVLERSTPPTPTNSIAVSPGSGMTRIVTCGTALTKCQCTRFVMRKFFVPMLALLASAASAQIAKIDNPPPSLNVGTYVDDYGFVRLGETPSMTQLRLERQRKGWEFLNANAHSIEDVRAFAAKCRNYTAVPDYCSIPEVRATRHAK